MSNGEWSGYPYERRLTMPELELPLAYAIPYGWGSLRVTEGAHQAYDLKPLVPTASSHLDLTPPPAGANTNIDIVLVAPDEAAGPNPSGITPLTRSQLHKKGVGIAIGFSKDKGGLIEGAAQALTKSAQAALDTNDEDILEKIVNLDGIPAKESLDHDVPKMMVNALAENIQQEVAEALLGWGQMSQNKRMLRKATVLGASSLAGTGLLLAMPLVAKGAIDPLNLLLPAGYLSLGLVNVRGNIKQYLRSSPQREAAIAIHAQHRAGAVGYDIYTSYSSDHFDRKLEEQINLPFDPRSE